MDDRTSLLNQLRIDRQSTAETGGSRLRWWIAAAAAVVLALLVGAWLVFGRDSGISIQTVRAESAPVTTGASSPTLLDASGYVVARRQATVSAKITGKVMEIAFDEGQRVAKDQVIAKLDDTNARASLMQALAQWEQSKATRDAAKVAFDNARPLYERNEKQLSSKVISAQDFDTSKATYDAARSNLEVTERNIAVAQATVSIAQRNLEDTVVRAPFAGVITVKAAQPGEIVSPISAGGGFTRTGLGTIVDMDSLEVEVDVSENYINRVRAEQPATITLNAYPDWSIPANVIAVIPTADRSKATVKVRIGFKEKDPRILPEMGARVSFLSESSGTPAAVSSNSAMTVPAAAVQANGETGTVFVVAGSKVERRAVRLGAKRGEAQIIVSGIAPGTVLAAGDLDRLSDGAKIHVAQ